MVSSAEVYECYICLEEYPIEEGVATCAAHFFCNDCIIAQFEMLASQQGFDTFLARCCNADTTIGVDRAHHLLSPEVLAAYRAKEAEFYTPLPMRVYCSSQECHKWLPATRFEEQQRYSVARCDCGTLTCVGCKGPWERRHRCGQDDTGRADWLPEYTSTCRIKKCPGCKGYIELREACNHMTCNYCAHEFCWVCLLPWDGVHNEDDEYGVPGCPSYGDPDYDGELYETNARGLGRDTGLNREGLDRLGSAPTPVDDGVEPGEEPWADLPDLVQGADAWDWEAHPEEPNEEVDIWPVPPVIDQTYLTFEQLDCTHRWVFRDLGMRPCNFCFSPSPEMPEHFHFQCEICDARMCEACQESPVPIDDRVDPALRSLTSVIQWAEAGEVPFRAEQHRDATWDDDTLGVQEMFDGEGDPWDHYVLLEDLGLPGFTMTVNPNNNPFAVLGDME